MKKIIISGIVAGVVLLILSVLGLYGTIWLFPKLAEEYSNPAFNTEPDRNIIYYIHPFVISMALSWFWSRYKGVLTGSFLTRGVEFGLIYTLIALFPIMLLIYGVMNVSLAMVTTWLVLGLLQSVITGLVFEKINP